MVWSKSHHMIIVIETFNEKYQYYEKYNLFRCIDSDQVASRLLIEKLVRKK